MLEPRQDHKLGLAADILRSGGTIRLQALGSSMLPSIWPGDFVTIESVPFERLIPGEIVLCERDNRFFIHRLIARPINPSNEPSWVTRGDALPLNDPPISANQLLGRVSVIHRYDGTTVPSWRVSTVSRMLAYMLPRWDWFRTILLRIHRLRQVCASIKFSRGRILRRIPGVGCAPQIVKTHE